MNGYWSTWFSGEKERIQEPHGFRVFWSTRTGWAVEMTMLGKLQRGTEMVEFRHFRKFGKFTKDWE